MLTASSDLGGSFGTRYWSWPNSTITFSSMSYSCSLKSARVRAPMIKAIPHTEVEVLLSKAQEGGLELTGLSVYCLNLGLRPVELLNALSIEVARRFVLGEMPYAVGDDIMNGLFTAIFDVGMEEVMQQPAFNIYLAIDEGEYQHLGDSDHIAPSERYSRPYLVEMLRGLVDTA